MKGSLFDIAHPDNKEGFSCVFPSGFHRVGFVLKTLKALGEGRDSRTFCSVHGRPPPKTASFIVPPERDKRRQGVSIFTSKHKQPGGLRIYDGEGKGGNGATDEI